MDESSKNFTVFDRDIFKSLTAQTKIISGNKPRNAYFCKIDLASKCTTHVFNQGIKELNRIFAHFKREHKNLLDNFLIDWLLQNNNEKMDPISCSTVISSYIRVIIFPQYESEKKKRELNNNISIKSGTEHCLDIQSIDSNNISRVILENGVYEHLLMNTISSKSHLNFCAGFMKLGFELGRNTNISMNDFLEICNGLVIPRSLLQKVGHDYFEASISYFKGAMAAFEIDAGTINDKQILAFVLSAKNRYQYSMLFDFEFNFEGDFESYQKVVMEKIRKAKENEITIVGLTTDNYPVQIMALSHESKQSIQNKYKDMENIIHIRCANHLLNLAYQDWVQLNNELSVYEIKIKNIMNVLSKKEFAKKISKKIPKIGITRWNSAFRALEMIFRLRKEIVDLYKNPRKSMNKDLFHIKEDVLFIFSRGFLEIYPLLFYVASLMDFLQTENLSCVDAIVIIEYFLQKVKNNIFEYNICQAGKDLYKLIKKRLILNKNVQIHELASLFTPDGIVRYRKIMNSFDSDLNIEEEYSTYFHCIKDSFTLKINQEFRLISVKKYFQSEYNHFISVIENFSPKFRKKSKKVILREKDKDFVINNQRQKQPDLYEYFQSQKRNNKDLEINKSNHKNKSNDDFELSDISSDIETVIDQMEKEETSDEESFDDESSNKKALDEETLNDDSTNDRSSDDDSSNEKQLNDENNNKNENICNDLENDFIAIDELDIVYVEENILNNYPSKFTNTDEPAPIDLTTNIDESTPIEVTTNIDKSAPIDLTTSIDDSTPIEVTTEPNKPDSVATSKNSIRIQSKNAKKIVIDDECYKNRKAALEWKNISALLIKNAKYLNITPNEAELAIVELHDLLIMPFAKINDNCPGAIGKNSKFTNFWATMSNYEYEEGRKFNTISKIAKRLYVIPLSEAGDERSFSKLNWRFENRRNRAKQKTMFNEIQIENAQRIKIESSNDFSKDMWKFPKQS